MHAQRCANYKQFLVQKTSAFTHTLRTETQLIRPENTTFVVTKLKEAFQRVRVPVRESRRPWGLARAPLALILKSKQLPNVLLSPAYCTHSDVLTRLTNMDMHFGTL